MIVVLSTPVTCGKNKHAVDHYLASQVQRRYGIAHLLALLVSVRRYLLISSEPFFTPKSGNSLGIWVC